MSKKGPDILIILTVLVASLIVAGAVIYSGFTQVPGDTSQIKVDATVENGIVQVPPLLSDCGNGGRCIVVETSCGSCCEYIAVNASQEILFNAMYKKACKRYMGRTCSCFDLSSYPSCVNGKCTLVKWPENGQSAAPAPAPAPVTQQEQQFQPAPQTEITEPLPQEPAQPAVETYPIEEFPEEFRPAPQAAEPAPVAVQPAPAPAPEPTPPPAQTYQPQTPYVPPNDLNAPIGGSTPPAAAPDNDLFAPIGAGEAPAASTITTSPLNEPVAPPPGQQQQYEQQPAQNSGW